MCPDMRSTQLVLTVKEACKELCVSRTTLYLLIKNGRIKTLDLGIDRVLITREEVDRVLRENQK